MLYVERLARVVFMKRKENDFISSRSALLLSASLLALFTNTSLMVVMGLLPPPTTKQCIFYVRYVMCVAPSVHIAFDHARHHVCVYVCRAPHTLERF